jgi:hypothetical protein
MDEPPISHKESPFDSSKKTQAPRGRQYVRTGKHPLFWTDAELIENTKNSAMPIRAETPQAVKDATRKRLAGEFLQARRKKGDEARAIVIEKVRVAFETGVAILKIVPRLTQEKVMMWAVKFGWKLPDSTSVFDIKGEEVRNAVAHLREADQQFGIVTAEEDAMLTAQARELKKQKQLLDMTYTQLEKTGMRDWGMSLRLKVGRLAHRAADELGRMEDSELLDASVMKTITNIMSIADKLDPPPETVPQNGTVGSILCSQVLFGVDALPKKAKAKEIEG